MSSHDPTPVVTDLYKEVNDKGFMTVWVSWEQEPYGLGDTSVSLISLLVFSTVCIQSQKSLAVF